MASSLETNKVLAAVLTAGVIAMGAGVVSRMIYHPEPLQETAYVIEVPEEGEGGEGGGEAAPTPIGVLLANADAAAGEGVAKACVACHSFEEGGASQIGPALHGIVGREIAAVDGFAYSDALAGMEGAWDYEALNGFLLNPSEWAPGTKMSYAGVKKEDARGDLIMYLHSISPDAPPLPEPEAAEQQVAEGGGEGEGGGGGGFISMIASADPAAGESASKKCAACHSFDEGGASKIGPALHGVVGREIAALGDFEYSDALAEMDGAWDYEALNGFLLNPSEWAPGTKMSYAGVKQDQERAELIAYLQSISPDAPPLPEGGGGEQTGGGEQEQAAAEEGEEQSAEEGAQSEQQTEDQGQQQAAVQDEEAEAGSAGGESQQQAVSEDQGQQQQQGQQRAAAEGGQQEQTSGQAGGEQQAAAEAQGGSSGQASEGQAGGGEQQQAATQQDGEQAQGGGGGASGGVVAMIADADPSAGETTAKRKCAVCHSFDEGGPNKVGPNLHGIVGQEVAAADGFRYSGALQDKGGSWDYAALDAFLADPRGWAQGTRMAFAGLKDEQERVEVISYLRSISPDAPELSQ